MTCLLKTEINPSQIKAEASEELNQKSPAPGNNTHSFFLSFPKNKAQGRTETEPSLSLNKSTCCQEDSDKVQEHSLFINPSLTTQKVLLKPNILWCSRIEMFFSNNTNRLHPQPMILPINSSLSALSLWLINFFKSGREEMEKTRGISGVWWGLKGMMVPPLCASCLSFLLQPRHQSWPGEGQNTRNKLILWLNGIPLEKELLWEFCVKAKDQGCKKWGVRKGICIWISEKIVFPICKHLYL